MNDLLADGVRGDVNGTDLEAGMATPPRGSQDPYAVDMTQFFEEVNVIKNSMSMIRKSLHRLEELHAQSRSVTKASAMKDLKAKMDKDIDDISRVAHSLKDKVEALDRDNIQNRKRNGCGEGTSTDRTRVSITTTLKKKLKGLMDEFQAMRQKFQDEYRDVVERRYYTVTGEKPDEETIEHLIDTGDSEQIFQRAIQEQGRGQILDTVAEIQERHDAVKDIEKKLLELQQVFLDMAVLVDAQGDLVDNIENQVLKAVDHVARGTVQLQKAKQSQKSKRKWTCIGVFIVLLIVIFIVVIVVKPWKKK